MKNGIRALIVMFSLLCPGLTTAQWQQVSSFDWAGMVSGILVQGNMMYSANGYAGGVWRSYNSGGLWWVTGNGLEGNARTVNALALKDTCLFAATNGGMRVSTDSARNWVAMDSGLTDLSLMAIAVLGDKVFAGTFAHGVFLSTDNGGHWASANAGSIIGARRIYSLAAVDTVLLAGTNMGVYKTKDNGASWRECGFGNDKVMCMTVMGSIVFAATEYAGLFRSVDQGETWQSADSGLGTSMNQVRCFAACGSVLFAGTNGAGVFCSTDSGANWVAVNTGLTGTYILSLGASETELFAGMYGSLWRRPISEMNSAIERSHQNVLRTKVAVTGPATLSFYDLKGRRVPQPGSKAAGVYVVRIRTGKTVVHTKIIIAK